MLEQLTALLTGPNASVLISAFVFAAAVAIFLAIALILVPVLQTNRRLDQELARQGFGGRQALDAQAEIRKLSAKGPIEAYFTAVEREHQAKDAIEKRLFEAGFYSRHAILIYNLIRVAFVGLSFAVIFSVANVVLGESLPVLFLLTGSLVFAAGFIVIPSIALDFYANGIKEHYRRGFPDFMDMMVTCADAGMSLEAAVERVSSEFAGTHRHLGIQLSILTL